MSGTDRPEPPALAGDNAGAERIQELARELRPLIKGIQRVPPDSVVVVLGELRRQLDGLLSSCFNPRKRRWSVRGGATRMPEYLSAVPPVVAEQVAADVTFVRDIWQPALQLFMVAMICTPPSAADSTAKAELMAQYIESLSLQLPDTTCALPSFCVAVLHVRQGGGDAVACRLAVPFLHRCLHADSSFAPALFLLGICYHRVGEHGRAAELFQASASRLHAVRCDKTDCLLMVRAPDIPPILVYWHLRSLICV